MGTRAARAGEYLRAMAAHEYDAELAAVPDRVREAQAG
jgi:hypothetical protein